MGVDRCDWLPDGWRGSFPVLISSGATAATCWKGISAGVRTRISDRFTCSTVFIGGGFWLLSAAWRVLDAAQASGILAAAGPYARLHHPQYVGFTLIMMGFLLQWPTLITLTMFAIMVAVYVRLARRDERKSAARFGAAWVSYARRTPASWPHWAVVSRAAAVGWKDEDRP